MYTIRIAIGNLESTEELIQQLWTELQAILEAFKSCRTDIPLQMGSENA
jgi:hypothetical protein